MAESFAELDDHPEGYSVKGHPMTKAARAEVRSLTTQNWRRGK